MNTVEVTGGRRREREIVHAAVAFCLNQLLPRFRTLDIRVDLERLPDAYGYCSQADTDREYDISIRRDLGLYDLISTVCHEMVHVKQYVRGELDGVRWQWRKTPVSEDTVYSDLPWEIEAHDMEGELAMECFRQLNVKIY